MVFCRMPETPRPSLLDELRQRSEALRAERAVARLPEERSRHEIDGALWRAYRWLDEAMGHLEVIRPEVLRKFRLGDYLTFDRLQLRQRIRGIPPPRARDRRQARARRDVLPARGAQARCRPGEPDGGGLCERRRFISTATPSSTRTRSFATRCSTSNR